MDQELAAASAIGLSFALSLLHAALPNHWLPFVLVGRTLGWSRRRTLGVLALAGTGHVVATSLLGLAVWKAGDAAVRGLASGELERFAGRGAGALLVLLGVVYLVLHARGRHGHTHARGALIYAHEHESGEDRAPAGETPAHDCARHASSIQERGAILTLFLALTFSPCEAVVAAFLSGIKLGLGYVLVLAIGSSVTTVLGMFVLTALALAGVERVRSAWLDRNEMSLTGAILVAIGALVFALPM